MTGAIALIGQPNVGKSALFGRLTGRYVQVSNYPGTTVEVALGSAASVEGAAVIDTPGIIMFPPRSPDEQVAAEILVREELRAVVQVGDAKNLRRTLLLTLQLAELGVPLVLALNMVDEARARGVSVDPLALASELDVAVTTTVATRGDGVQELIGSILVARRPRRPLHYPPPIEAALEATAAAMPPGPVTAHGLALLWLSGDATTEAWVRERSSDETVDALVGARKALERTLGEPPSSALQRARLARVDALVDDVLRERPDGSRRTLGTRLGELATHRVWSWPILAAVLYATYWFVGVVGAGRLVGLVEDGLFGEVINPWVVDTADALLPPFLADLIAGEYGLWTMGMTYAIALVLPIVTTFFIAFGILEDSGYLARLTVVSNRVFTALGLNGKAVLPMVLGLGCVTMATLTTRVLETRRERLLAILLLALAVPCSAQLGVVLGLLGGVSFAATAIWGAVVVAVLLSVGFLAARLVPGERSTLVIELPPLRRPGAGNVLVKTAARVEWYLREAVPLFLVGTAALFALDRVGALPRLIEAAKPLVTGWLGLPAEASAAFLLGFLRRDFGATGLFSMEAQGLLTEAQMVVAMVTITLFIPCIASVLMIARERGTRVAALLTLLVFPLAFLIGGIVSRALALTGWGA